jgi:Raf kinase inhibitor-like YbhB/YbcL family protein
VADHAGSDPETVLTGGRSQVSIVAMNSRRSSALLVGALLLLTSGVGCNRGEKEPNAPHSIYLTSADFPAGIIGKTFTCDGKGVSPELSWSAAPPGTQSFALVVTDRDSPLGYNFVHWVIYDIPANTRELPAGLSTERNLPEKAKQGLNDDGKAGYFPPCPPGNSFHRYDFVLYAVDRQTELSAASKKELLAAIRGHVLAIGEIIGRYRR